jgi:AraC family transcriptional regulator
MKPAARIVFPLDSRHQDLTLTLHRPASALRRHRHREAYATLVLRGSYTEDAGARIDRIGAGDLVIHPAGERHDNQFDRQGALCLNIGEPGFETVPMDWPSLQSRMVRPGWASPHRLGVILSEVLTREDPTKPADPTSEQARSPLSAAPEWILQVNQEIHRRFRERVTLTSLARSVGYASGHVARTYRKAYGVSVGTRLRALRASWAQGQIQSGPTILSVVAMQAGFADQSHMTRVLKKVCGSTPGALRRSSG